RCLRCHTRCSRQHRKTPRLRRSRAQSDGQQILFGGTGTGTGLSEVGLGDEIATRTEAAFKSGLGAIGKLVTTLEESVGAMPKRPDKIEL
ncbi:MAG: hypothetical protein ACREDV_10690, partial [Methylocella sp.]